jgi:hypothetical protein
MFVKNLVWCRRDVFLICVVVVIVSGGNNESRMCGAVLVISWLLFCMRVCRRCGILCSGTLSCGVSTSCLLPVVMCPGVSWLNWWEATNASGCNGDSVDLWDLRFSSQWLISRVWFHIARSLPTFRADVLPKSSEYKKVPKVKKHVTDIGRGTAGRKFLSWPIGVRTTLEQPWNCHKLFHCFHYSSWFTQSSYPGRLYHYHIFPRSSGMTEDGGSTLLRNVHKCLPNVWHHV